MCKGFHWHFMDTAKHATAISRIILGGAVLACAATYKHNKAPSSFLTDTFVPSLSYYSNAYTKFADTVHTVGINCKS